MITLGYKAMRKSSEELLKCIATILQWVLNCGLLILAIVLVSFLIKETYVIASLLFNLAAEESSYQLLEGVYRIDCKIFFIRWSFSFKVFYLYRYYSYCASDYC